MKKLNSTTAILLDLDGVILDLEYDSKFWKFWLPETLALESKKSINVIKNELDLLMEKEESSLNWYDLNFWDELLTAGHRLWGFANDDFHDPADFDNAFNMVLVEDMTPAGVVRAAKAGRCYASTGLLLLGFSVEGSLVKVQLSAPCDGRFIGSGGVVLSRSENSLFEYEVGDEQYVRFEGVGEAGRIFLQPMFRDISAVSRK